MWAKYWAFEGMRKLSSYNKETHAFGKRDKGTVAPFPDLNREALAYVVDALVKKANKADVSLAQDDPQFKKILDGANFGKLYAYAIEKVTPTEENELLNTTGEWVKYDQGSNHMPLVESLQGHGTGWCTAGEMTAKTQLQNGDFYVYYSQDKQGAPTIPRVAIRMEDTHIGEVRGIAYEQNLDPYIADIAQAKLQEFGSEGGRYQKKTTDMKTLTHLEARHNAGEELTQDDLRFLYEIDSKIEGFGYEKDPRIQEILGTRGDIRADLSRATGFKPEEISMTVQEAQEAGIKYHHGNLDLSGLTSAEGVTFPEHIGGDLDLHSLTSAEGLTLPEHIGGDLDLHSLTSAEKQILKEKYPNLKIL